MAWREKSVIKGERTSVLESVTARDCSWIKERKEGAIGVSHCDLLQEGMHLPSLEVAVTISSFNNIFLILWPWTSTYDLGCQASPTQGQGIPSRQMTRPEVISLWPLTSGQLRTLAAWATPLFVTDVWGKIIIGEDCSTLRRTGIYLLPEVVDLSHWVKRWFLLQPTATRSTLERCISRPVCRHAHTHTAILTRICTLDFLWSRFTTDILHMYT